jgi:putative colanic acid biosysnthesis UDP-glucose lipid carrier transferase
MRGVDRIGASEFESAAGAGIFSAETFTSGVYASSDALAKRAELIEESRTKHLFDIACALVLLVSLLPVFLVIAVAVKTDSRGPVLFKQERYGRGKRVFLLYKFRTMTVLEASGSFIQARAGDVRFTRLGRFLRRTSVDELPQLLNVLKGDMSLVGPRPHAVVMDDTYARVVPNYLDRHLVRPGMTGLAQVAGHRGPTNTPDAIAERLRHDRIYIRSWSLWLDISILARTPWALLHPNAL